ncbi:5'/3'-nucleotidase SurE [Solimonas sp. SE-A11]|uniref:5'/3'-nucleotidase SurE n=1 Tax=Solimonas sp. SE-A11 TaxID=3054954 RepID=UPI00259CA69B|nr:5'/3'-nucleotidase SurE [Solimonas sp. SE-A11]MDM4772421.1 5'/3'-nucleotidase SurE [Solimonas sp. SE-A11]
MKATQLLLVLGITTLAAPAQALNIVLSNDDGFETANIRALYQRLKAAGHDVIVSAPTQNNSGRGGSMNFLTPVTPMAKASRHGSVAAGSPGVGKDPGDADVFYVDGTPVMSMLHGLDVVAVKRWGQQPDLVVSGFNEGNNTGLINNSSGTVNNLLYAVNRGIPAIAASYEGTEARSHTALAEGALEYEIADVVVKLVDTLEDNRVAGQPLLPPGVGLNLNIPKVTATGQAAALPFRFARMGLATEFQPVFFEKLSDSPVAVGYGAGVALPGISFANDVIAPPAGVVILQDDSALSELNVMKTHAIPVTVVEGVPQGRRSNEELVKIQLRGLLGAAP